MATLLNSLISISKHWKSHFLLENQIFLKSLLLSLRSYLNKIGSKGKKIDSNPNNTSSSDKKTKSQELH